MTTTVEATPTEPRTVTIPAAGVQLAGELRLPPAPVGAILFVHAGPNDLEPRTHEVTDGLNGAGLGTLALDLLRDEEAHERASLFDVALLARRLSAATRWLRRQATGTLPLGYLGAGTGASAALWAAADPEIGVSAVVSYGGWPDLCTTRLSMVRAPTLLVVGGVDSRVLELNRTALANLPACEHQLAVVPGATHLFEQYGTLEKANRLAGEWFVRHLGIGAAADASGTGIGEGSTGN